MRLELNVDRGFGRRGKIVGAIAVALVAGLFILESTVLRGEQVARVTVGLGPNDVEKIPVDRVGEKHLVEVDTTRWRGGENEGRAVKIRLEDPSGAVVYEDGEWASRKERFFSFTPAVAGPYEISVRPSGILSGSSSGNAYVRVFVNDRRIFSRLFAALPF